MVHKREHLEALLGVVDEVCKDGGNAWFKEELEKRFPKKEKVIVTLNPIVNDKVLLDIRKTKFYLRNFELRFLREANHLYNFIVDPQLKRKMVLDYKEMRISFVIGDVLEYSRRMALQLERAFDYIITDTDGWKIVEENNYYEEVVFYVFKKSNIHKVKSAFFKSDYNDANRRIKKKTSEIDFKKKAVFCLTLMQINFEKSWTNFSDILFLRNQASHGTLANEDKDKANKLNTDFYNNSSYYQKMLTVYLDSLRRLFSELEKA